MPEHKVNSEALVKAILIDDLEGVRSLLETVAQVPEEIVWKSRERFSPLESAVSNKAHRVVRYLIEKGVDVNKGRNGVTPLLLACDRGDAEIVRLLLSAGANPNARVRSSLRQERHTTPLIVASMRGHMEVVKELLQAGADAKVETGVGKTALTEAALTTRFDLARELVRAGCSPSGLALLCAASADRRETACFLLSVGANPNYVGNSPGYRELKDRTPLDFAVRHGAGEFVDELLAAGADANLQSAGQPVLSVAAFLGKLDIVRALLGAGADLECANWAGRTALACAVDMGHTAVAEILLKAGANPRAKGRTKLGHPAPSAVEIAETRGDTDFLQLVRTFVPK